MDRSWNTNRYSDVTWNYRKIGRPTVKYSAGILPYTFDQNGKCLFLLGKDLEGDWSDFGGRCEFVDKSEPTNTASREFYEETLGAVMTIPEVLEKITNPSISKIISKTLNGSNYYMYLLFVDCINYSEFFNKTLNFVKFNETKRNIQKIIEKVSIRWVTMDTLINCIENKQTTPIPLRGIFHKTISHFKDQLLFLQPPALFEPAFEPAFAPAFGSAFAPAFGTTTLSCTTEPPPGFEKTVPVPPRSEE